MFYFQVNIDRNNNPLSPSLCKKEDMMVSPTTSNIDPQPDGGSRLVNFNALKTIIRTLLCPKCKKAEIDLHEKATGVGSAGFRSLLKVWCANCECDIITQNTSDLVPPTGVSETNIRAIVAARDVGIGYAQLVRFFSTMNMPKPMHLRTYQSTAKLVNKIITYKL